MLSDPAKIIARALLLLSLILTGLAKGEDLASAIAAGRVTVTFHGTGGSTGNAVEAVVTTTRKGGESLDLTVRRGTRLISRNAGSQSMVINSVKGQVYGGDRYIPSCTIEAASSPKTYLLDAYCTQFEKDNPSPNTRFTLGRVDPILGRILTEAADLSPPVKQAAVWIYTDKVSYAHINQKFRVKQADWNAAVAIAKSCLATKGK